MEFQLYRHVGAALLLGVLLSACTTPPPEPAPQPAPVVPDPVVPERFPSLLFDSNVTRLSPEQRRQIRFIASVLKEPLVAERSVRVEGHTDAVGNSATNERISLQRARAVANELIFNGVPPERLTVVGHGDTQPVASNTLTDGTDDPEGRSLNRRVDIIVEDRIE